jgi:hypothetical protein
MNTVILGKNHIGKATLEKEAIECFCANHQILPSKVYSAMLSCFEKMIYREFSGQIEIISLPICKRPEREISFVIPI